MRFNYERTHKCHELNTSHVGKKVTLSGWVHRRRDLGGLIFIDLRDRFGYTQLVINPQDDPVLHATSSKVRSEWVISVQGIVAMRLEGMNNPRLATGEIEIQVQQLEILSPAKNPPFSISDETIDINEELRLKYRYLDIRRGDIADKLCKRHEAMLKIRNYLNKNGFIEITTPILAKSTPEGARDYLIPSRIYPGNFYALPQSPQIFKQLLMISGMDRYFQIATCFRDEDLRADRQPEFTQIDMEISFENPQTLMSLIENLMIELFQEVIGGKLQSPFLQMTYKDCQEFYGTDRPDLRFGMRLIRIDDIIKQSHCNFLIDKIKEGGCIKSILVKKGSDISRKQIESYEQFIQQFGIDRLSWLKKQDGIIQSNLKKFFDDELITKLLSRTELEEEDILLIVGGGESRVNQSLDQLRRLIAKHRDLMSDQDFKFLWVIDFPLMKWNEDQNSLESEHHPFTMPHPEDIDFLDKHPLKVRALAYDLVLNGYEIGGGSQRIHQGDLQEKIFNILQLTEEDIQEKFGFFIEALQYGTPPHLGIALGFDRIMMILTGTSNIRDVIAFPKTQKGSDLMLQAPSKVSIQQLNELDINIQSEPIEITWI